MLSSIKLKTAIADLQKLIVTPEQLSGDRLTLTPQQYHYLARVLRLHPGDRLIVLNGLGDAWLVELLGEGAEIIEPITLTNEVPIALTLLVALPKTGFEEIVRMGTELGVTTFIPLLSARSLLKPSPQKLERWRRIAQEATEQCERSFVPGLLEPLSFSPMPPANPFCYSLICVARGDYPPLLDVLQGLSTVPEGIAIATGPEGGWSEREVREAIAAGWKPVSLGKRIYRAVTAPVVALSIFTAWCEQIGSNPEYRC